MSPALIRRTAAAVAAAAAASPGGGGAGGGHLRAATGSGALQPDVAPAPPRLPLALPLAPLAVAPELAGQGAGSVEAAPVSNLTASASWPGAAAGHQVVDLWQHLETAAAQWEGAALSHLAGAQHHRLRGDGHGYGHDDDGSGDPDIYPDQYKLLREEDTVSWVVFFVLFFLLLFFDNFILHSREETISFGKASAYTVFWLLCAGGFNIYVYFARGKEDAFAWGTGYLLEWMLSVDNLFVFRSVFLAFGTPDEQKHKPLFWGIIGAIIFRMAFFVIEEVLLHSFAFMHYVLGIFLVYTGIKIVVMDEEEEVSPEDNVVIQKITEWVPFVNAYAPTAKFIARIPHRGANSPPGDGPLEEQGQLPLKATRLLLVVVCLELTDVVFAVDSVSAIVAQIPDLFLAYTACVFAMLGLRATFFVVDELVKIFSLLSYAVAAILVFIGVKLCLRGWIHIEPAVVCAILVSTLVLSMVASLVWDRCWPKQASEEEEGLDEGVEWGSATKRGEQGSPPLGRDVPEDSSATAARS